MNAIEQQITAVFRDVFEDDELEITRDTTAVDIEGWDSLQHVTLIVGVEARLGVRFTSAEVAELKSVGELIELVHARLPRG